MKIRKIAILGVLVLFVLCALFQGAVADDENDDDDDDLEVTTGDWFEDNIGGIGGQVVSTIFWVIIGLLLVLGSVGVVDTITDRMKHNWLNLEEVAGNPTAMAILAAGLMVAIAIIIHGATLG